MMVSLQKKAFAMILALSFIAGCSSTGDMPDEGPYDDTIPEDERRGGTVYGGEEGSGISSEQMTEEERRRAQEEAQRGEEAAMRKITTFYFDFDTAEIKSESRDVLVAHAEYLSNNPDQNVRLEGHADERGSKEYNLALGERRANAVQRFLVINGVSRDQIETVSYGEEKPAVMGSGESVWSQNRRVEMIFE